VSESFVELRSVSKSYGRTLAVDDLSLSLAQGSLVVILGPAGAGKTTTLRMVAGLETPSSGSVWLEGQDVTRWQPNQRDLAMVFDNLALYPNRTGYENIAFPLRRAKRPAAEIDQKVKAIAEQLRINHILNRLPATFSGGERQRVALGRAMVRKPRMFLLDEPLSSLDFMLRIDLRTELKRLQKELGESFLYATPDYTEALALGDMVCVLLNGKVRQQAPAQTLYDRPADREVARFVGNPPINLVRGELGRTNGAATVRVGALELPIAPEAERILPSGVKQVEVGIRPENVLVSRQAAPGALLGRISDIEPLGMHTVVEVDIKGAHMTATIAGEREFEENQAVGISVVTNKLIFFDLVTGRRIGA
jgi:multiple sugar transport system ATP-binding protein